MITFQNEIFKTRNLALSGFGNVLISTISLNEKLLNENGTYTSEEALKVDEQIFYFVEKNEISLPNQKLAEIILNQLK